LSSISLFVCLSLASFFGLFLRSQSVSKQSWLHFSFEREA
jgi:hypothetical protein